MGDFCDYARMRFSGTDNGVQDDIYISQITLREVNVNNMLPVLAIFKLLVSRSSNVKQLPHEEGEIHEPAVKPTFWKASLYLLRGYAKYVLFGRLFYLVVTSL